MNICFLRPWPGKTCLAQRALSIAPALLGQCLVLFLFCANAYADPDPEVCSNVELLNALRIVNSACTEETCDFSKLEKLDAVVDREQFLTALSNPHLRAVHIFFPSNEYELSRAFDWLSTKSGQISTLRAIDNPERSAVFVIGSASVTGAEGKRGDDHNRKLSYSRMQGVLEYLKEDLRIECKDFRVGFLGREIMQLSVSDGSFLKINSRDYRNDEYVLNQSVHVFVFPCKEKI